MAARPPNSINNLARMKVSKAAFDQLTQMPILNSTGTPTANLRVAQTSSWAVWASREGKENTSWSRDTSILHYGFLGDVIHADAVFIALNDGGAERADALPEWHMFHSGARDYMLAEAVEDTWLWGAYMTDFYKGMATKTAAELKGHLDSLGATERESLDQLMADQISAELTVLGARDPLLIAIGNDAEKVVRDRFGSQYRVAKLTHYSAQQLRKDDYRAEVKRLVEQHPAPGIPQELGAN